MGQLLRTVLIWLVALAVPAQGMAAATMLHCGPGHHGAQATQHKVQALAGAPQAAAGAYAAHGHVSHPAPDVSSAGDSGQNASSLDASGAAQTGKAADAVKGAQSSYQKCSACASCCAGLALPSTAVMPPTIDPAREVTVLSPSWAASVVVDGPERPPRILRA